jgi:UDP-3-O-[3-hydroxymyristoyl] glucosamine N-acyltransferase
VKLKDIASLLDGELSGSPDGEIRDVKGMDEAAEGDIAFVAGKKQLKKAAESRASCLLVAEFAPSIQAAQIKVADPQYAFAVLLGHFHPVPRPPAGVDGRAFVAEDARLAEDVSVQAFAYISSAASIGRGTVIYPGVYIGEGAAVGEDCVLCPGVVLMHGVEVGNRVTIHANSVVGSDGFGYMQREEKNVKIPQVGGVIVGNDVEIGAAVAIDRATAGNTVIGRGTKIDNLAQIAHNVKIGENSIIVAQVAIGGSPTVGNNVMLGGQAGIADHAIIEDGTLVGAKGGVMGTLKRGIYSGSPVIPHRDWLKASALFAKLPELNRRIALLEKKLIDSERGRKDD